MGIKEIITATVLSISLVTSGAAAQAIERAQEKTREAQLQEIRAQIDDTDIDMLARLVWGEARGCSTTEQAAVIWCVLNRVDAGFGDDIRSVVTAPSQFTGYRSGNPVTEDLRALAEDVLFRWEREKHGYENVGRVLPREYLYFAGDGRHNYFRTGYKSSGRWDWSLESPYM